MNVKLVSELVEVNREREVNVRATELMDNRLTLDVKPQWDFKEYRISVRCSLLMDGEIIMSEMCHYVGLVHCFLKTL